MGNYFGLSKHTIFLCTNILGIVKRQTYTKDLTKADCRNWVFSSESRYFQRQYVSQTNKALKTSNRNLNHASK